MRRGFAGHDRQGTARRREQGRGVSLQAGARIAQRRLGWDLIGTERTGKIWQANRGYGMTRAGGASMG